MDKLKTDIVKNKLIVQLTNKTVNNTISINDDTKLFEDLGFDDIDMLELAMELEIQFNISINDTIFLGCKTVGNIIDYLNHLL